MAENKTEVSNVKPPVATGTSAATKEAHEANNQVNPASTAAEVRKNESKEAETKVAEHKEGAKEVKPTRADSPEEKAAKRAGVPDERMTGAKIGVAKDENGDWVDEHTGVQNRNPRNEFEKENQKVTEQERKAAQKVSDMSTSDRVKNAETPSETAHKDAERTAEANNNADLAAAIRDGLKGSNDKNFTLTPDTGVEPRFSLVRSKDTGEVLLRENETGALSQLQLKSIEEKEASIQDQEVEEL